MNLLSAAKEDLDSQSGRIGPNLKFLQKIGKTYLNNGQVDDRQFLVRISCISPCSLQ